MKLPNGERADLGSKIEDYVLNPSHWEGAAQSSGFRVNPWYHSRQSASVEGGNPGGGCEFRGGRGTWRQWSRDGIRAALSSDYSAPDRYDLNGLDHSA
jgi:hypothetical protein